jgi:hypothetical protein
MIWHSQQYYCRNWIDFYLASDNICVEPLHNTGSNVVRTTGGSEKGYANGTALEPMLQSSFLHRRAYYIELFTAVIGKFL